MNLKVWSTQSFRDEHRHVREEIEAVRGMLDGILEADPVAQRTRMAAILEFLERRILPHEKHEEQRLYPIVDDLACGMTQFTSHLRYEHCIVSRWTGELARELASNDVGRFARRAENLLGLLEAHCEIEEEVLLPLVDARMSAREFENALGRREKRA
jgi:hemerythrin-like domain-containing protein